MGLLFRAVAVLAIIGLESGSVALPIPQPTPGPLARMHQSIAGQNAIYQGGECRDSAPHHITEIALERTPCFGTCPDYTVTLRADGTVTYVGREFVTHLGTRTGSLSAHQFDRLASLAEDIGFMDHLAMTYTCGVTDNPTVYVSIVRNGKRKTIGHYAPDENGPMTLWSLELAIDDAVNYVQWK